MNTSEVLNKAADLIERRGWTTGNEGLWVTGPHCALGSIGAAYKLDDLIAFDEVHLAYNPTTCVDSAAGIALCEYLGEHNWDTNAVWGWNDEDGRTKEDVVEALRAAALIEAAKRVDVTVVTPAAVMSA